MSTVRPNLRGSALIAAGLDAAVASTGFAVVRPGERVHSQYLLFHVLSDPFVEQLTSAMRGGHYPAVKEDDVARACISVPPLEEQRKVAEHLEHVQSELLRLTARQRERDALLLRMQRATLEEALTASTAATLAH